MSKTIDCLFIGHNEVNFQDYATLLYEMGEKSPAYRDLKLNFIWHKGKRYTVMDIFNKYSNSSEKFNIGDIFSTAIAYLATYLHRRGFSYDYINNFQLEKDKLKDILLNNNVLSIGITTTLYTVPNPIYEICSFIRKYNKDVVIIIGGPFVLNLFYGATDEKTAHNFLKQSNADFLINSSQGEATLIKLLSLLKSGKSIDHIPNITYLKNGNSITNPINKENNSLDENYVDWRLFSNEKLKFVGVRTCLSCPFNCSFCGFCQRAGKHQTTTVETIEKELDMLENIRTVKTVNFVDDTFNVPLHRFKEILRMMIRKKYSFKWNSYFRCQFADEEMVKLMEESGCEGVYLGIESANQNVLNYMNKMVKVDQYKRGISLLKNTNILIHTNFLLGFVGETDETINDTIKFIKDYEPDFYRFQLWFCDPLTPIWKNKEQYNIKGSHFMWLHNTMNSVQACDIIDEIFLSGFKTSTWIPVHNFNLHNLYRLKHIGMSVDSIKGFLGAFSDGIKESIRCPDKRDVSEDVILKIKKYLS